jgi:hypothetical protein
MFERPGGAGSLRLDPYPRHARVHDVPTELLLIIFKLVHAQEITEPSNNTSTKWPGIDADINSPCLFPYAIAAVCSRWRDIMSLIPEFWTLAVIVVDLDSTIPPATVMSWSRNLPLEVVVTRIDFDGAVDVRHEQDQVVSVMGALVRSHVNRSRKLYFNVKFSSSLPPFPDSFRGVWSNLSHLFLQCQEDNGGSTDIWGSSTSMEQQLQYPALTSLVIDGRNYYNACRKDLQWTIRCPFVFDLSISHYTPLLGELFSSTTLTLPIIALPSLGALRINDLSLQPSPYNLVVAFPPGPGGYIQLSQIHDFRFIADMLDLLHVAININLTRCAMGLPRGRFNAGGSLTLRDIEADEDLMPLLRRWDGVRLYVDNCPGFNDIVLDVMTTVDAEYFCAPFMAQLDIADCPNFSVAALKRLVSAKLQFVDGGTQPGIRKLRVSGLAPDISIEDQQQISQHVYEFDYDPSLS